VRQLRVLHCPTDVGGNPQSLVRAERSLGLESTCVTFTKNYLDYTSDEVLWDSATPGPITEIRRLKLAYRAMRYYDVIHFNSGMPILPYRTEALLEAGRTGGSILHSVYEKYVSLVEFRDLALMSKLGKVLAVTYQGDDARQGDYCREHFTVSHIGEVEDGYYTAAGDAIKRVAISKFDRYADKIYALNPDLLYVLPEKAEFVPYASVDLSLWKSSGAPRRKPVIAHAPTHRKVKGTRFIEEAVNRLKNENIEFDFVLVENMSHSEAKKVYESSDLLVDQLLVGWYGAVATEFMALGKPVVAYIREEDLKFIPASMKNEMPIIKTTAPDIYRTLKSILTSGTINLSEIGARSRQYVEKWHDPMKIALKLKQDYESAWNLKHTKKQGGLL
jgi:hypothetical protein